MFYKYRTFRKYKSTKIAIKRLSQQWVKITWQKYCSLLEQSSMGRVCFLLVLLRQKILSDITESTSWKKRQCSFSITYYRSNKYTSPSLITLQRNIKNMGKIFSLFRLTITKIQAKEEIRIVYNVKFVI